MLLTPGCRSKRAPEQPHGYFGSLALHKRCDVMLKHLLRNAVSHAGFVAVPTIWQVAPRPFTPCCRAPERTYGAFVRDMCTLLAKSSKAVHTARLAGGLASAATDGSNPTRRVC